jgi:hypothetical protein
MSPEEIYSVARYVGFPPAAAVSMVAIALKESGGNPQAYNGTPPDDSYGLWQINMYGALGPDRRRRYNLTANSDLFDPYVNGRAAYDLWAGNDGNFARHWAIDRGHNRDRYLANLPRAQAAAANVDGGAPGGGGPDFSTTVWAPTDPPVVVDPRSVFIDDDNANGLWLLLAVVVAAITITAASD